MQKSPSPSFLAWKMETKTLILCDTADYITIKHHCHAWHMVNGGYDYVVIIKPRSPLLVPFCYVNPLGNKFLLIFSPCESVFSGCIFLLLDLYSRGHLPGSPFFCGSRAEPSPASRPSGQPSSYALLAQRAGGV